MTALAKLRALEAAAAASQTRGALPGLRVPTPESLRRDAAARNLLAPLLALWEAVEIATLGEGDKSPHFPRLPRRVRDALAALERAASEAVGE